MIEVTIEVPCGMCKHDNQVRVNLINGEFKVLNAFKPGFENLVAVVDHYKKLKGFDQIPTWDSMYRLRSMAAAKKLLFFFRKMENITPVEIVKEYLTETADEAKRKNWNGWTIEGAVTRAGDWLAAKTKGAQR